MDSLILASSSPRRRDILTALGIPFSIIEPDIDETAHDHLPPEERVIRISEEKGYKARKLYEDSASLSSEMPCHSWLILSADTLVAVEDWDHNTWTTIGKPSSRDEAREMLEILSGRTHRVFTGMTLLDCRTGFPYSKTVAASVTFAPMTDQEISWYLDSDEWKGVAGAYRIQGKGSLFIESIEGSWSCVMGLPIRELYGMLRDVRFSF